MKKDSINVFSEGLVSDLNPLTTPNNVLTDCVNGTFITFNGDELALQNEAGNTKVKYEEVNLIKDINWTLNESETVQVNFLWRALEVTHNQFSNLVTYSEDKFQFLYLSIPEDGIVTIFNQLDYKLYDSTLNDVLAEQEFFYIGTRITPQGKTHKVYRKKDTFNTNNKVLFKVKVYYQDIEDMTSILGEVSLHDGFIPIGIKEEGGVLYIVSRYKPVFNVRKWNHNSDNPSAYENEFVYSDLLEKTYYRSKINGHLANLPTESNDFWEVIGSEEDFTNYISFVQIGTYPSPEFAGETQLPGKEIKYIQESDLNSISTSLYRFQTINDNTFKPGRWVVFQSSIDYTEDHSNLSRENKIGPTKRFYNIKLYNQLNNGYLDLSKDIWDKYLNHTEAVDKYWFRDSTFEYHCPNQYKGKLAVRLEIEDLDFFRLKGMTSVEFIPENEIEEEEAKYKLKIKVETKSSCDLIAKYFEIRTRLEGETIWSDWTTIEFVESEVNIYEGEYVEELDVSKQYKIIEYEIKPDFYHKNNLDDSISNFLPNEYKTKYIIKGKRIISSDLEFNFIPELYECGIAPEFNKTIKKVSIKNLNEEYINTFFQSSSVKYIYMLAGETLEPDEELLGTYEIDTNGYPIITRELDEGNIDDIELIFGLFKVLEPQSSSCMTTEITFNLSIPFDLCSLTIMTIKQGSNNNLISPSILNAAGKPLNGFSIEIEPNILTQVTIDRPGFEQINDTFMPSGNMTRSYAFIAKIRPMYRVVNSTLPYEHFIRWDGELALLPTVNNLTYRYFKKNESPTTIDLLLTKQSGLMGCYYESNKKPVGSNIFTNEDSLTIFTPGQQPLNQVYTNITNTLDFSVINSRLYNCGIPCLEAPESDYIEVPLIVRNKINPALMLGEVPGGLWINITVIYVIQTQGGWGNGLGGSLIVGNREYSINTPYPQTFNVSHGPLVEGTYNINADLLTWSENGFALQSHKFYQIDNNPLMSGGIFDVVLSENNIEITIYVSSNSESIQI